MEESAGDALTKRRNNRGPRVRWSPEQAATLVRRYPYEKTQCIANDLGIPLECVYRKAKQLGLKKTDQYLASQDACRLRQGDNLGAQFRYPKGHVPANKGLRRPGYTSGRMAETQFKKGRKPEEARNYKPIGSVRTATRDGYLERKVSDDPSLVPARRWVAVHRLVWEAVHGPIPAGFMVAFKPGMKTLEEREITLDRLEMISRRENMRRNSYHTNLTPELRRIVQLRGAITRQINKRKKGSPDEHEEHEQQ